jgi:DNA helicase IV
MLGSISLLIWHRKTTIEEREKRLILEQQERQLILDEKERQRIQALIGTIEKQEGDIISAYLLFENLINSQRYISKVEFPKWLDNWKHVKSIVDEYSETDLVLENDEEMRSLKHKFINGEIIIKQKNEKYIQQELEKNADLFDTIEDHPLTENQRTTIVVDETNNLIVAGAGTGKTSTIIGKAGYLLKNKYVQPEELLLISFARKARDEMYNRGREKINEKLNVHTFHSLGLFIIGQVEGKRPSISELSTDRYKLLNAITSFIEKRSKNSDFLVQLNDYFAFHQIPYVSEFHFDSKGEYIDYLKKFETRSLNGDLVKSLEELEIANYLFLNGIEYEYESNYEIPTADKNHRQYKPDFYLPEKGIYIEHFGIDENNKTAPFVDNQKYLEEMDWKREIHSTYQTKLIETYSWHKKTGILLDKLGKQLLRKEVDFKLLPPEQTFEKINKLGLVHPFSSLLATFLNLYKSSDKTIPELLEIAKTQYNSKRYLAFLHIFSEILDDYQESLLPDIDFNDMINRASNYLRQGKYSSPFKYVLVDEFQDISQSRYFLLEALLQNNPDAKSFCVGDDWQSIYRFTGSDISIMKKFDDHLNPSEIMTLNKTFRFNNKLCDVSTKFILENPNQITKQLTTQKTGTQPAVTLHWTKDETEEIEVILKTLSPNHESSVFILGRYNHQRPKNLRKLRKSFPNITIEYHTVHSSKGKQSDYVIIVGLESGKYSFPSQIEDDPVLNLVLADKETVSNAEERRLFYVAITRAKEHVHLLSNPAKPSSFTLELEKNNYDIQSLGNNPRSGHSCPDCGTGIIVSRWSERGQFFACNNYPYCQYIARTCPQCGQGFINKRAGRYVCSTEICSFNAESCPRCSDGYLVERFGRTKFYGCNNYPSCRFTRSISSRRSNYRRRYR